MNNTQTQQVKIALELTGGGRASSDVFTLHESGEDGPTLEGVVGMIAEITSPKMFRMQCNGAAVYFNPAHIVTAQIVRGDAR